MIIQNIFLILSGTLAYIISRFIILLSSTRIMSPINAIHMNKKPFSSVENLKEILMVFLTISSDNMRQTMPRMQTSIITVEINLKMSKNLRYSLTTFPFLFLIG